jgi:hypothetical protein
VALPHVHVETGQETFLAVVAGAFLASIAGFATNQIEHHLHRAERERAAALLFGEIIASLGLILDITRNVRDQGDPWGPVTLRMVRAARRESDTYARNRESLFDIRDPALRARIHALFVRLTISLDGVTDATGQIDALEAADVAMPDERAARRLEVFRRDRDIAFEFGMALVDEMRPLLERLKRIARYGFEHIQTTVRREMGA